MSKHFLEDMVKPISHISPRNKIKKEIEVKEEPKIETHKTNNTKSRSRYTLWLVALISVVVFLFALSFLFGHAEVSVTPKMKDVVLNKNLSADKDSNTDVLPFDLIVIGGLENKTIQVSGEKDISNKATGSVILYNAFSSSPQTLSIDTRLEGSNGKIYKTQTKTILPGVNKDGTPGSLAVNIYADSAGQEYNSAPLDFKIAGFKGTPKYSKFYGRSVGEITGGFKGKGPAITDAEKTATTSDLKNTLEVDLLKKATAQIPSGFVLFKDAVFLQADDLNIPFTTQDNNLTITLKGTLYGILFNEQKLTKKIAEDNIENYDGSDVYIPNIRDLTFSLSTQAGLPNQDNLSFDSLQHIDFNLAGTAKVVWKLDVNKFTSDLLGKSKSDFNQILSQYSNVDSATLTISPIWKMSIPDKSKDIKLIVNYPK